MMMAVVLLCPLHSIARKPVREFYQLTVYHFKDARQEKMLDHYLEHALLPALHRAGITKAGVFKNIANDTLSDKTLYILVAARELERIILIPDKLKKDTAYQSAGSQYINAVYNDPPYSRMETLLLRAFTKAPEMQLPVLKAPKEERVYELRSYESASEKIFQNKVHMFNEGDEIGLFKRLNFNAVFYSEVIAGGKMPNLMYMTCFESMADRNAHWKAFGSDPAWKKLSSMPEYKNNVSHIDITFLRPVSYSDY
ncbi:MAG: NIPSNAP family protein [Chitinophagaceae bacterium]|nr:NIPSNAP family protein [Chitinophagaceae bacterium]